MPGPLIGAAVLLFGCIAQEAHVPEKGRHPCTAHPGYAGTDYRSPWSSW